MRIKTQLAALLLSGFASSAAMSQDATGLYMRGLAATCANCHGTEGRTAEGSHIPSLAGMPRDYMITQIKAFKDGSRPATVMHQLSKGFTDQQIESVATYFGSLKR
jgi:sulfide dehydrogenase cytochrome subunit